MQWLPLISKTIFTIMTVTYFPQFTNLNGYCYKTLNKENMRMRTFSRMWNFFCCIVFVVKMCVRGNKHVFTVQTYVCICKRSQTNSGSVIYCYVLRFDNILFAQKVKSYPDMQFQAHFSKTVYVCIPKKKDDRT